MVSSKCCQVESFSPLMLTAALMPPCAQTECERRTGTMEKRSTGTPASAILMAADSPASPPPTTMILPAIPPPLSCELRVVSCECTTRPPRASCLAGDDTDDDGHGEHAQGHEDDPRGARPDALGTWPHGNA